MAWLTGMRWPSWRFLLPSAGTLLAVGWIAILIFIRLPDRRKVFARTALLLMLCGSFLLWILRLAWIPADHRIGTAAWIAITVALIGAPIAIARLPRSWLIASAPLLVFAYHMARTAKSRGAGTNIADEHVAVAVTSAALHLSRDQNRGVSIRLWEPSDTPAIQSLVRDTLAEYGFDADPQKSEADIQDIRSVMLPTCRSPREQIGGDDQTRDP